MEKHVYVAREADENGEIHYTDHEHETWSILIKRQKEVIKNRACDEYVKGVEILDFPEDRIPRWQDINEKLEAITGWGVAPVPAVIPALDFFNLLANKKFPVASFIRIREELDYLQEPDLFHEFFGHCPLLTNQAYADFMERYAKIALQVSTKERNQLFRLFWFTIEFGLIKTEQGLKIFGGGILSSFEETIYALESEIPKRVPMDPLEALRTPFRIDIKQPIYFILENIDQLYRVIDGNILDLLHKAQELGNFPPMFEPKKKKSTVASEGGYAV
ncbi:phenylalanine 4-monooxygenase [Halobacteriovorax sp. GB3]|uniref:phenylalanine 4-monooxygenase n=1 Tax=Halobacteriovorax sp. GB3 TaxID=2719615 RepID=UPI00235EAD07|nr:phenylalanine 4-monooxygenase [Halobacteriovorax sp. GB3]MDD0853578.1 phenylalanine 4-monooxygenase [Halobacteriovorax sp. GB3]